MKETIFAIICMAFIGIIANTNSVKTTKVVRTHTTYVVPQSSSIIIND